MTLERDGLIFYNGRLNHQHDFLSLEVVDSQVRLNFSSGGSWTIVDPYVHGGVNDGKWHTVEMKYYNEVSMIGLARPGVRTHLKSFFFCQTFGVRRMRQFT